jgi:hypothetical protein
MHQGLSYLHLELYSGETTIPVVFESVFPQLGYRIIVRQPTMI